MSQIAFLGTGLMGAPMVRRLLAASHDVKVWNRDEAKARALLPDGAHLAQTPAQAVHGAQYIFTMLSDGTAVEDVIFTQNTAQAMGQGAVLIDCSSIAPDIARDHDARLAALEIAYCDCPVSGGVAGATDGTLSLMAGGGAQTISDIAPVMAALGRLTHVGPAGAGQICKLANQQIVAITIGALAEAMVLVQAGGADRAKFRDAIRGGFAESRILDLHGARMVARDFTPGGPSRLQLKDLDAVMGMAQGKGLTLPLSQQIRDEYADFVAQGHAEADHSGLLLYIETLNAAPRANPQDR
ncbi:2-hydroxy-3-oxopropionate reductase [Thioclava sp. SK-1]|uniref:NAD(P)-dependent oxidoreductase n=1 Tax=Thioclava sp. SK-1 TaxID=1889770 RepID=UPI0008271509|nr:NAD(P)-dependent oxidoreductase [Thioclava sp. SK-1]OCX64471.1 2-hydroxy-3-oxopropionate reductase [Thioclava sp. SK-1]